MNGIASWMTLKNSNVKKKLVLTVKYNIENFYGCVRLLSSIKFVLKIIFQSPKFDRSIFFLEVVLCVEEKCLFFLPLDELDRIQLFVQYQSIHVLSRTSTVLEDEQVVEGLDGFCFSLGSACKRKYFRLRFRGFLLVVVALFADQLCDHFVQTIRNSDPRVRIVFVHRINSDFHCVFASIWLWYPTRVQFWRSLESHLSGLSIFHLVENVLTTWHCFCKLKKFVSMFCHKVLSDFNCFQESCINTNLDQLIWLWKLFQTFFVLLQ